MSEARHGRCARQGGAEAQDMAVQKREARQGRCVILGRAYARGKAGHMRVARPVCVAG
jgi:hypothetical protein